MMVKLAKWGILYLYTLNISRPEALNSISRIPRRTNMKNIIKTPIQKHSKKPDVFRKLIERLTDNATPRIEYFARTRIHGWNTFGNDEKLKLEPLESYNIVWLQVPQVQKILLQGLL